MANFKKMMMAAAGGGVESWVALSTNNTRGTEIIDHNTPGTLTYDSSITAGSTSNYAAGFSHDGQYLGIRRGNDVDIYSFSSGTVSLITSFTVGSLSYAIKWSPNDDFIAVACQTTSSREAQVWSWDGSTASLVDEVAAGIGDAPARDCDWNPDGTQIVFVCTTDITGTGKARIFDFNGTTLTYVDQESGYPFYACSWSYDGNYIALATSTGVRNFDVSGGTFGTVSTYSGSTRKVCYMPSGQLARAGGFGTGNFEILNNAGPSLSLQSAATVTDSQGTADFVKSLDITNDGAYAVAVVDNTSYPRLTLLELDASGNITGTADTYDLPVSSARLENVCFSNGCRTAKS